MHELNKKQQTGTSIRCLRRARRCRRRYWFVTWTDDTMFVCFSLFRSFITDHRLYSLRQKRRVNKGT